MVELYPHPSFIEIDIAQFKKNIALIKAHIGECLFCLPVKANAYGHGLCQMAHAAAEAKIDRLAVAHLQEGIRLRRSGIALPILVLGAIHEDQIADLIAYDLELTISSLYKAHLVIGRCQEMHKNCRVHIEVDTGMQRTGVRPESAWALLKALQESGVCDVIGIYSHLATSDSFAQEQCARFKRLCETAPFSDLKLIRHLANSAGVASLPESYFDMVRPSLLAFGYLPSDAPESLRGVAPCFSVKSRVSYFKVVEAGVGISYGHTYKTESQTRIVTVPIGYGDGYRRSLSNRAEVLIRGKRFPIVGTICMDQLMVDVGHHEVYVGDEVVLIGHQGGESISVQEIAALCDTIPYEVLCFFNERLPRVYARTERVSDAPATAPKTPAMMVGRERIT